jgi:hypothetical protein
MHIALTSRNRSAPKPNVSLDKTRVANSCTAASTDTNNVATYTLHCTLTLLSCCTRQNVQPLIEKSYAAKPLCFLFRY